MDILQSLQRREGVNRTGQGWRSGVRQSRVAEVVDTDPLVFPPWDGDTFALGFCVTCSEHVRDRALFAS